MARLMLPLSLPKLVHRSLKEEIVEWTTIGDERKGGSQRVDGAHPYGRYGGGSQAAIRRVLVEPTKAFLAGERLPDEEQLILRIGGAKTTDEHRWSLNALMDAWCASYGIVRGSVEVNRRAAICSSCNAAPKGQLRDLVIVPGGFSFTCSFCESVTVVTLGVLPQGAPIDGRLKFPIPVLPTDFVQWLTTTPGPFHVRTTAVVMEERE